MKFKKALSRLSGADPDLTLPHLKIMVEGLPPAYMPVPEKWLVVDAHGEHVWPLDDPDEAEDDGDDFNPDPEGSREILVIKTSPYFEGAQQFTCSTALRDYLCTLRKASMVITPIGLAHVARTIRRMPQGGRKVGYDMVFAKSAETDTQILPALALSVAIGATTFNRYPITGDNSRYTVYVPWLPHVEENLKAQGCKTPVGNLLCGEYWHVLQDQNGYIFTSDLT